MQDLPGLEPNTLPIVLLLPAFDIGGTERQVVEFLRAVAELPEVESGRVEAVVLRSGGGLESAAIATGVSVTSLRLAGPLSLPGVVYRWVRFVRERRPVVVYSLLSKTNVLAAATRWVSRPAALVWGIRDDRVGIERHGVGRFLAIASNRLFARLADRLIVNSQAIELGLQKAGFPPVDTVVVHNGVDTQRFRPDVELRRLERATLGLSDEPLLVCVARIVPKKNHDLLIRAFAEVVQVFPTARLVCVGDGPAEHRERLAGLVVELGLTDSVALLAARDDPESLFNAGDLGVLASGAEGFPNAIAESLACGTPCVATAVGEVPALLAARDVVAVGDTSAFAAAVIEALKRPSEGPRRSLLSDSYGVGAMTRATLEAVRSAAR